MKVSHDRCSPYPLLVNALRLLPGIRPVCERHRLGEAKHRASLSPRRSASVNGVPVTLVQLEELFLYNEHGGPRVSQEGAALLLQLFAEGAFDSSDCREVEGGLELLTQYSKGLATVIDYRFGARVLRPRSLAPAERVKESKARAVKVSFARSPNRPNVTVHRLT
jgi:hypothetical protein